MFHSSVKLPEGNPLSRVFGVGFEEPSHFLRPNWIKRCGIILVAAILDTP